MAPVRRLGQGTTGKHLKTFSNAAFRLRLDATEKSSLRFEPGGSRFASSVMYGTLHDVVLRMFKSHVTV